jgi:hypothetical protein
LRQAAEFIELEGGENYKSILERLTTAALNDELPMYLPGENLRHDYGPKPRKRLCVRDFYDQTYWNDLNAWLVQYEPRITCQFPQPSSQPPPDGRAGSTGTESHICSTATRVPKERPLKQRVYQEEEVLRAIRELGHDPMALPKGARGRPGVKKEARSLLSQFSRSIFDKTWMRLRSTGRLAP